MIDNLSGNEYVYVPLHVRDCRFYLSTFGIFFPAFDTKAAARHVFAYDDLLLTCVSNTCDRLHGCPPIFAFLSCRRRDWFRSRDFSGFDSFLFYRCVSRRLLPDGGRVAALAVARQCPFGFENCRFDFSKGNGLYGMASTALQDRALPAFVLRKLDMP